MISHQQSITKNIKKTELQQNKHLTARPNARSPVDTAYKVTGTYIDQNDVSHNSA